MSWVSDVGDGGAAASLDTFARGGVEQNRATYLAREINLNGLDANVLGTRSHCARKVKYSRFASNEIGGRNGK